MRSSNHRVRACALGIHRSYTAALDTAPIDKPRTLTTHPKTVAATRSPGGPRMSRLMVKEVEAGAFDNISQPMKTEKVLVNESPKIIHDQIGLFFLRAVLTS